MRYKVLLKTLTVTFKLGASVLWNMALQCTEQVTVINYNDDTDLYSTTNGAGRQCFTSRLKDNIKYKANIKLKFIKKNKINAHQYTASCQIHMLH